eukprot:397432_1
MTPSTFVRISLVVCILFTSSVLAEDTPKGKQFLLDKKALPDVTCLDHTTDSPELCYKILKRGSGKIKPTIHQKVDVHYEGTTTDGKLFDSSYKRNKPATFVPAQTIRGFQEGLKMMVEGDKFALYISSDWAYGSRGAGSAIGPNEVLIFVMELVKIHGSGEEKEEL